MRLVSVIRRAELYRGNVQGVVFEGTPEREEKQERVKTGSARSAGQPTKQIPSFSLTDAVFRSFSPLCSAAFQDGAHGLYHLQYSVVFCQNSIQILSQSSALSFV